MPGTQSLFHDQSERGASYRGPGKYAFRGSESSNSRSTRSIDAENINPSGGVGGKRISPRLATLAGVKNGRPLSARRREGAFGADITNITSGSLKALAAGKEEPQSGQIGVRRREAGSAFGTDITNITSGSLKALAPGKEDPQSAQVGVARRREAGSAFGADITNITSGGFKADKMKSFKPFPQPLRSEAAAPDQPASAKTESMNVQEVDEYASDIMKQLFMEEQNARPLTDYMDTQKDLTPKMRTILVDWLIEVHAKYKLRSETLHLALNIIDRYLSKANVARSKLQLVGVTAMFVASKFEEIDPPELHQWVYITDKAYTKQEVLLMECTMLSALSFQIVVPTAAHFFPGLQKANGCNSVHCKLAQYILELGLLEIKLLRFTPSQTVSAALFLSNELLGHSPRWPQNIVQSSGHSEESLRPCLEILRTLFEQDRAMAPGSQLQAVHKKFSTKEHHAVATMRL